MRSLDSEGTLMRIHVGEGDRHHGRPLYQAIVEHLRARGLAGATVFRGVMGFGASATIHSHRVLRLSTDLPVVIECVDLADKIEAVLPELDSMIGGGLVTLEKANVILYRPDENHDRKERQ